mmetsp:Transcript_51790/g.119030  ORF Transcript_51790/g.119030 Transcript_51790/m.119030 type:complete len:340 (-) Transcript_51790:224-1243(-)
MQEPWPVDAYDVLLRTKVPPAWQPRLKSPLLQEGKLHTIVFVSSKVPTAAVALAVRSNPGIVVLVLAPASQRRRVHDLGATWANVDEHDNELRAWNETYRQSAPGSRSYWRFCHSRWLALAAALRDRAHPPDGVVVALDDDVLLFERLGARLQEVALYHPLAQAETVVNGAFVIASAAALERLAAFLWTLYSLPTRQLATIAWRFGTPMPLSDLHPRDRSRIYPGMVRHGRYPRFTDMDAISALRLMSRHGELPQTLRVRWAAGHKRRNCAHAPKATALLSGNWSLRWVGKVPHRAEAGGSLQPLCFLHLQGPQAKERFLRPMLHAAGIPSSLILAHRL